MRLPRVHVECDFIDPVTLDEFLVVEVFFSRIGGARSISISKGTGRNIRAGSSLSGRYVLVTVEKRAGFKTVPVPDEVRERLAPYVESAGDRN